MSGDMNDDDFWASRRMVASECGTPTDAVLISRRRKPVGAWEIAWGTYFEVLEKTQTDEQIANVEKMFGWKWHDYSEAAK